MKTTIALCSAAIMLFAVTFRAGADIVAGPITNPANGHDYYLLSPNSWTMSEAEAESLGGTLAVIKNADEQKWVFSKFGAYGGTNRNLWIGLHRTDANRSLIWITGAKLGYVNWSGGQPDDSGGVESYVFMASANRPWGFPAGGWNDYTDNGIVDGSDPNGVVEVPGKSNEKSLTSQEKSLIGTWYESGKPDRQAWIVGTDNLLFLITHDRHAARLVFTPEGILFDADRQYGEIIKDKILWSNGTWWSRKPVEYVKDKKSSDKDTDTKSADAKK